MNKNKKFSQKDVWELIIKMHNEWTNPNYHNHVRTSIEKIEKDNNVEVPIEWVWKLDQRYQKMRNGKPL